MLKRIDESTPEISGYSYMNADFMEESVLMKNPRNPELTEDECVFQLKLSSSADTWVYRSDIPKLIKALQAAYDHKEA